MTILRVYSRRKKENAMASNREEANMIVAAIFTAAKMAGDKENNPKVYLEHYKNFLAEIHKLEAGEVGGIKQIRLKSY